jgi:hypothetical protein
MPTEAILATFGGHDNIFGRPYSNNNTKGAPKSFLAF